MRRIFVGCSGFIGFDVGREVPHPVGSGRVRNPILFGSGPLNLLYDEIWFASPVLCPYYMRKLPHVRFLSYQSHGFEVELSRIQQIAKEAVVGFAQYFDIHKSTWILENLSSVRRYALTDEGIDRHSTVYHVSGSAVGAFINWESFLVDLLIVDNWKEYNFDLYVAPPFRDEIIPWVAERAASGLSPLALELIEKSLRFNKMFDVCSIREGYHCCSSELITQLRSLNTITEFRKFWRGDNSRFGNQSIEMAQASLEMEVASYRVKMDSERRKEDKMFNVFVEILGGAAANLLPGYDVARALLRKAKADNDRERDGWKMFIVSGLALANELAAQTRLESLEKRDSGT